MGLWNRLVTWLKSMFWAKELELTVLGLQNAGKTTFVNLLATDQFDEDTSPTIGFNFRQVRKGAVSIKIWDLGGQPRFRDSWEKYCRNVNGIVYIVDSADFGNLDVARGQLHQLLANPSLSGTPLLVLGNKNDLEGALNEEELAAQLSLHELAGRQVACYSVSVKNQVNIDVTLSFLSSLGS